MCILTELFNSPKLNAMLQKFNAGAGQEDLKSELFAVLCEQPADKLEMMQKRGELIYFATGIVQKMIFQKGGRFNRKYRNQTYEISEHLLAEQVDTDKEKQLQQLEKAINTELHWVEKSVIDLHQKFGSIEKVSKETKISQPQVSRIYRKGKEKLKTALSGKIMGNYIVATTEIIIDVPKEVSPENINEILDEANEYIQMRLTGRIIPSKDKTNSYIKDIKELKLKKLI